MDTFRRLEELMSEHNMTLYSLSKESGINYSTLRETKRTGRQLSVDTIELACQAFGIRPYEFFMTSDDYLRENDCTDTGNALEMETNERRR